LAVGAEFLRFSSIDGIVALDLPGEHVEFVRLLKRFDSLFASARRPEATPMVDKHQRLWRDQPVAIDDSDLGGRGCLYRIEPGRRLF
jgi:hypothetical protein